MSAPRQEECDFEIVMAGACAQSGDCHADDAVAPWAGEAEEGKRQGRWMREMKANARSWGRHELGAAGGKRT